MKATLIIGDGIYQVAIHPENEADEAVCAVLHKQDLTLAKVERAEVFECRGGYVRHTYGTGASAWDGGHASAKDLVLVFRPKGDQ